MFDVRPVSKTGDLDWEKIKKIEKILKVRHKAYIYSARPAKSIKLKSPIRPAKPEKSAKIREFKIKENDQDSVKTKPSWQMPEKKIAAKQENYFRTLRPLSPYDAILKKPKNDIQSAVEEKEKISDSWRFIREKPEEDYGKTQYGREKTSFSEKIQKEKEEIIHEKVPPIEEPEQLLWEPESKPETVETNHYADDLPHESDSIDNYAIEDYYLPKDEYIKVEDDFGRKFSFADLFSARRIFSSFNSKFKRNALAFAGASLAIFLVIGGFSLIKHASKLKNEVLGVSSEGMESLNSAVENIKNNNFEKSGVDFQNAYQYFSEASSSLGASSDILAGVARYIPVASQFSSGKYAVEAGKHMALAGDSINQVAKTLNEVRSQNDSGQNNLSLLNIYDAINKNLKISNAELKIVQENLDKINLDDLPEDKKEKFLEIKTKLPSVIAFCDNFLSNSEIFTDLLGGNGPRKYLFLFQNNQEMRPTGGFIGSYGVLDISNGHIRNFFIDGIFNPDGQLTEKIVPPNPVQKVSAAWSLHDSNWWPDFPRSARKAILFYEKTGGPTVDGVMTLTPTVMQKLLEITGPIEMPDYDMTLTADNFIEKTQYEVEVDYDKEENQPKKILSDLAPMILDKIFNGSDPQLILKAVAAITQGLDQKQILLYSENEDLQKIISTLGWSGEVLGTSKDYLSVINTNINGYKTDGVIDEEIRHDAEIQNDGSIVDTVTITRHHNGGDSEYEWWNKVNADYLRVYVPLGSKLLEAKGQTREFTNPPLDYNALGFKRDPDVEAEEKNVDINLDTGTRVYSDSEKTVFANWTYVSPKEIVVLEYKYLLPFKIKTDLSQDQGDSYSILFQKQSGSIGSKLIAGIKYPDNLKVAWQYPSDLDTQGKIDYSSKLETDKFLGIVFSR
jgi:hypothetical protein